MFLEMYFVGCHELAGVVFHSDCNAAKATVSRAPQARAGALQASWAGLLT